MIVREAFEDYVGMVYTYSDRGMMIRSVSDGELYDEAYDPAVFGRRYEETDVPVNGSAQDAVR